MSGRHKDLNTATQIPGPGEYTVVDKMITPTAPSFTLKSRHENNVNVNKNPGPGAYTIS